MKKLINWKKLIKDVSATGMTQAEIGAEIGLKQPSVNQLSTGFTVKMYYEEGAALLALHKKRMAKNKATKARKST